MKAKTFHRWLYDATRVAQRRERQSRLDEQRDMRRRGGESASCDDYFYETMRTSSTAIALETVLAAYRTFKKKKA